MLNTKNMLMLVVLSAGLVTALTGTGVSQVVLADKDECEDNGHDSCNEQTQKIEQDIHCKIVNKMENDDKSDSNNANGNGNGDINCWNFAQNPDNGDATVDADLFDPIFGPIS